MLAGDFRSLITMIKKDIYVSDGEYFLIKFSDEEKENYMKLMFPENNTSEFYMEKDNRELFWRVTHSLKEIDYSIYDAVGEYCGNLELKNYDTATPEMGINLLENYKNRGIAGRVIKMLAKKYYEENSTIEYYVLKVFSYNLHSRHVIEKMGAELVCQEETLLQKATRIAQEQLEINKVRKGCQMDYGLNLEEQEEVVYRYHLLPDAFLQ